MIVSPLAGNVLSGQFVIAEWRDAGGPVGQRRFIAPTHVHHGDDEAWYVLEGTLAFRIDNDEIVAPSGSAVFVPQGRAHTYWNPTSEPARYLIIMTPNIHHLIQAIHGLTDRSPQVLKSVFERHNSTLLADS